MKYDVLIVGAGLFGCVFAYLTNKAGKKCLVIDKRKHTGGNVYCENVCGINVHKYGAHIFHTPDKRIWDFVNSFVQFNRYTNSPLANYHGKLYNLPFNMNTFYQMWGVTTPEAAAQKINSQRNETKIITPENLEQQALTLVGKDIYETLVKGYTEKQGGRKCSDLPAFIIKRLPVRMTFDNNYFNDTFQGIPQGGYNILINNLLENIEVKTETDFFSDRNHFENCAGTIVYTGKIDEFFEYCYGKLDYRSLDFQHQILDTPNYQGNAVINFTDSKTPYTRIIEHKHFEFFGQEVYKIPKTVITKEFPKEYKEGLEPYYPVNDKRNNELHLKYKELALTHKNVVFGGRLAEYRYYDMDKTVKRAAECFEEKFVNVNTFL